MAALIGDELACVASGTGQRRRSLFRHGLTARQESNHAPTKCRTSSTVTGLRGTSQTGFVYFGGSQLISGACLCVVVADIREFTTQNMSFVVGIVLQETRTPAVTNWSSRAGSAVTGHPHSRANWSASAIPCPFPWTARATRHRVARRGREAEPVRRWQAARSAQSAALSRSGRAGYWVSSPESSIWIATPRRSESGVAGQRRSHRARPSSSNESVPVPRRRACSIPNGKRT